jgi:hypothetical protein
MAAASLDDRVTIDAGVEAGSQPDVKGDSFRKGIGRALDETPIDDNQKVHRGKKDFGVGIDEYGNFFRLEHGLDLSRLGTARRYVFHRMHALVDRFCERNTAPDRQGLRKFCDDDSYASAVQTQRHARCQVTSAEQKDES